MKTDRQTDRELNDCDRGDRTMSTSQPEAVEEVWAGTLLIG